MLGSVDPQFFVLGRPTIVYKKALTPAKNLSHDYVILNRNKQLLEVILWQLLSDQDIKFNSRHGVPDSENV